MAAGYSGTPLPQKLGIKPGHKVSTVHAPAHFEQLLGPLPEGAAFIVTSAKDADVIVLFQTSQAAFEKELPRQLRRIQQDGAIWVAWPKKASGMKTDLSENPIRDFALSLGLVDIKVCAIDETWSGLKLVIRKENRAKGAGVR